MVKLLGSLKKELISTFLATTHLATLCWGGEGLHYQENRWYWNFCQEKEGYLGCALLTC